MLDQKGKSGQPAAELQANLIHAVFRDIGLACVNGGAGNTYRTYWTMTLGSAR